MSNDTLLAKALELSPTEKLQLIGDLWDSLSEHPADIPLTTLQAEELDRRMEDHRRNSGDVVEWKDVQRQILGHE